ncbi:hypothetical protein V1511DRAFT_500227 [Dipodascopsis uninucleata]
MTSYQSKAAPTHYNDALPIHFASASGQGSSMKAGGSIHRQLLTTNGSAVNASGDVITGAIQSRDGAEGKEILSPIPSRPIEIIKGMNSESNGSTGKQVDEGGEVDKEATRNSISTLLESLLSFKSTLPDREFQHYSSRLRAMLPKLTDSQCSTLYKVLAEITVKMNKSNAKEMLLQFMMVESGIGSWATGLRRIIDTSELEDCTLNINGQARPPSESSWVEVNGDGL